MDKLSVLKEIYEKYSDRMLAVCMRYCARLDLAQDMMHDGFIQVYKSLDKFEDRGDGAIRAWTEKIMVNTCLQYLRKHNVMKECVDIDTVRVNKNVEAYDSNLSDIPKSVLMHFLTELPTGYRTVFNLYVFEDLSHKEIGRLLGISEKTSSSQFFRARSILATKVKEYEKGRR